jgi:hypothetical protein
MIDKLNKHLHNSLRGFLMNDIEFHSHEQQDEFIYNLFGKKRNGFFLDVSCGNPIIGSNTYTLEKWMGWQGFCFDISDVERTHNWSQKRTSRFIQEDATSPNLTSFLLGAIPNGTVVDYISLDVDAAGTNLALPTLKRILEAGVKFKAMTFEHECYIHGPNTRDQASVLLQAQGYIPLFSDVRHWMGGIGDDSAASFEDWWIDPTQFDSKVLDAVGEGLYYFECVEKLKKSVGNEYQGTHACSRAWPDEYKLFWNEGEESQLRDLFTRMESRN